MAPAVGRETVDLVLSENCALPFSPTRLRGRPVAEVQHAAHALPTANDALVIGPRQRLNELVPNPLMIPFRVIMRHELREGRAEGGARPGAARGSGTPP